MTRKDVKGDQPSGGETTWTNTGATRYGRGQHKTGSFGDDMLRPSPNHGTQRLPNDDESGADGTPAGHSICVSIVFTVSHIHQCSSWSNSGGLDSRACLQKNARLKVGWLCIGQK